MSRRYKIFLLIISILAANATIADFFNLKEKYQSFQDDMGNEDSDFTAMINEYFEKEETVYKWVDTGKSFKTLLGGTAYQLNVTSLDWFNTSVAYGPYGSSIWWHTVVVIIPETVTNKNTTFNYLTGGCNEGNQEVKPTDEEVLIIDEVTHTTGCVGVLIQDIPNCHLVFPSQPGHKRTSEDSLVAWTFIMAFRNKDPRYLAHVPMAKAGFQVFKAVKEFLQPKKYAITNFMVAGASKRGWTTWLIGIADCKTCVEITAIMPIVPIVPNLVADFKRQYQSYNGFTWAIADYVEQNITEYLDDPLMFRLFQATDAMYHWDRLARLPKYVLVSSDDEFMQLDWTSMWFDYAQGETHLLIMPNTEHSCASGLYWLAQTAANFLYSIANNQTQAERPSIKSEFNNDNGEITMNVTSAMKPNKVIMYYAQTLTTERVDFRWVKKTNGNCSLPGIEIKSAHVENDTLCVQPIIWDYIELTQDSPGVYKTTPPEPAKGFWMGYYIQAEFNSSIGLNQTTYMSSPAHIWPNRYPYPECFGAQCKGHLV